MKCYVCGSDATLMPRVKRRPVAVGDEIAALTEVRGLREARQGRVTPRNRTLVRQRAILQACDTLQDLACCDDHVPDSVAKVRELLGVDQLPGLQMIAISPVLVRALRAAPVPAPRRRAQ